MDEPLLIHSLGEFSGITVPILEAAGARKVCEIGAEHGGNSTVVGGWLAERGGILTSIDPSPSAQFLHWSETHPGVVRHLPALSLDAIPSMEPQDAWFIDGDHNWYTVHEELHAIRRLHRAAGSPILALLHDVGWPCARRDLYYAPDRIPAPFRQPFSWDLGLTLSSASVIEGGFRGCGVFAVALNEGGPRNGVLTAVEDFVGESGDDLLWAYIPGVFGLGVLFDRDHPAAESMAALLAPLHDHPLLARLERNRLANYLKVIEWQDSKAKVA